MNLKSSILTADISDLLPIIYAFKLRTKLDIPKTQFLYKRIINENLIKPFTFRLHEISRGIIKSYNKNTQMNHIRSL